MNLYPNRRYTLLYGIVLVLLFCLSPLNSQISSQWQINIIMPPNPSPYIADWETNPNVAQIQVFNFANIPTRVRFHVSLNGVKHGFIGDGWGDYFDTNPGIPTTVYGSNLLDWSKLNYNSEIEEIIGQTGRFPEDSYELCVELWPELNPNNYLAKECINFGIKSPLKVMLINPADKSVVTNPNPLFQWTAMNQYPGATNNFRFMLVPVKKDQSKLEAIESNIPLVDEIIGNSFTLTYSPSYPSFNDSTMYAWRIQSLDENDEPIGENNGYSEIFRFSYKSELVEIAAPLVGKLCIRGNVNDLFTNKPVDMAEVTLIPGHFGKAQSYVGQAFYPHADELITTETDGNDAFVFCGLEKGLIFMLSVEKDEYLPNTYPVTELEDAIEGIVINLERIYGKIEGRVTVKGTNKPISNMLITLTRSGTTKEDFPNADSPKDYSMADGLVQNLFSDAWLAEGQDKPVSYGNIVNGTSDNYMSSADNTKYLLAVRSVKTDADGRYYINKIPPDENGSLANFELRFNYDGEEPYSPIFERKEIKPIALFPNYTNRFDVQLKHYSGLIKGYVVDKVSGQPIENAEVILGYKLGEWDTPAQVKNPGQYDPNKQVGKPDIFSYSTGYGLPYGIITGVLGAKPPKNNKAEVSTQVGMELNGAMGSDSKEYQSVLPHFSEAALDALAATIVEIAAVKSNKSGYFQFQNISVNHPDNYQDAYALIVNKDGYHTSEVIRVKITPNLGDAEGNNIVKDVGNIELKEIWGKIFGTVHDQNLNPVPEAMVSVYVATSGTGLNTDKSDYELAYEQFFDPHKYYYSGGHPDILDLISMFYTVKGDAKPKTQFEQNIGDLPSDLLSVESLDCSGDYADRFLLAQTQTDADGNYTLIDVPIGKVDVVYCKAGYSTYVQNDLVIKKREEYKIDVELKVTDPGFIRCTVKDADNPAQPIYGAIIKSPHFSATGTTLADGTCIVGPISDGMKAIIASAPGYDDGHDIIYVPSNDTTEVEFLLHSYKGSLELTIIDSLTGNPIPQASFRIDTLGIKPVIAGSDGVAKASNINTGTWPIIIEGTELHAIKIINATIIYNHTTKLTVKLIKGGKFSGRCQDEAKKPIPGVLVTIDGFPQFKDTTDLTGSFELTRVSPGLYTLLGMKPGYAVGKLEHQNLAAEEEKSLLVLTLTDVPVDSIYGFAVVLDEYSDKPGGHKQVKGRIAKLPNNQALNSTNNQMIPFNSVELDENNIPITNELVLSLDEMDVKIYSFKAKLLGTSPLKAKWDSANNVGLVQGAAEFYIADWQSKIPGCDWGLIKIANPGQNWKAPAFSSDGQWYGVTEFALAKGGVDSTFALWGFKLKLDFPKSKLDNNGFHFAGSLEIPNFSKLLNRNLDFENLAINSNYQVTNLTLSTNPALVFNIGIFKFTASSGNWSPSGLVFGGSVNFPTFGNTNLNFQNLKIDPNGNFLNCQINVPSGGIALPFFGLASYKLKGAGLGTNSEGVRFFNFNGSLTMPQITDIGFDNLKITEKGEFFGTITFNQNVTFGGIIELSLEEISFREHPSKGREIYLKGGFKFEIPCLSLQVGYFHYYEDNSYALDKMGFGFQAGPVTVAAMISYINGVFEGSVDLDVVAFSVKGYFKYGGSTNWFISIEAGVTIPVGPVAISDIGGGLGREGNIWTFCFWGSVSISSADKAIKISPKVCVVAGGGNIIVEGEAGLVLFDYITLPKSHIVIDFGNTTFYGDVPVDNSFLGELQKIISFSSLLNFEVKGLEYWYVGMDVNATVLGTVNTWTKLFMGSNYTGANWLHSLTESGVVVPGHPELEPLDGVHVCGSMGFNIDWEIVSGGQYMGTYFYLDWLTPAVGGGGRIHIWGSLNVVIVTASANAFAEGYFAWVNGSLEFYASFGVWVDVSFWTDSISGLILESVCSYSAKYYCAYCCGKVTCKGTLNGWIQYKNGSWSGGI